MGRIYRTAYSDLWRSYDQTLENMDQQFIKALSEIIREEITGKKEVTIDGLGVFKPVHQKQFQHQFEDGRVVMMPPKDKIAFVPDKKLEDDNE